MKKVLLLAVLAAATLSGCATTHVTHKEKCMGGGAIAGGLLLGPLGAVGGVAIGHQACK